MKSSTFLSFYLLQTNIQYLFNYQFYAIFYDRFILLLHIKSVLHIPISPYVLFHLLVYSPCWKYTFSTTLCQSLLFFEFLHWIWKYEVCRTNVIRIFMVYRGSIYIDQLFLFDKQTFIKWKCLIVMTNKLFLLNNVFLKTSQNLKEDIVPVGCWKNHLFSQCKYIFSLINYTSPFSNIKFGQK